MKIERNKLVVTLIVGIITSLRFIFPVKVRCIYEHGGAKLYSDDSGIVPTVNIEITIFQVIGILIIGYILYLLLEYFFPTQK
jgi:hypothetical protein